MIKIPIYKPSLTGSERQYVLECIDSTWISSKGEFIERFEGAFAARTEVQYATTVSNGTVALHLALVALGIGPGDEVIVPTLTYVASANAIRYTGATPVFADSDEETWQLDVESVRKKMTDRTKAVMAVHLYGHPCDMAPLQELCGTQGLYLIEDCAEAFGSTYRGRHVGSFGDISTYSFFGNKTITTGEGGMVVTNNRTLYERAKRYKGQGLASQREYWHDVVGYNYRMTNICAAIGLAQLERADDLLKKKRRLATRYADELVGLPLSVHRESEGVQHSYWMFSILVDSPQDREPLRQHMASSGIETRPVFYPVHTMPMYSTGTFESHPVAEGLAWRGINLPSWPDLSDDEIEFICHRIRTFFAAK